MDTFVATLLIVICSVFLYESWDLPPGTFEPLGSGPIPQTICVLIIAMCVYVIVRAWRRDAQIISDPDPVPAAEAPEPPRPLNAIIVLAGTVIYILAMALHILPFWLATMVLVFSLIAILSGFNRKSMMIGALLGVLMGAGCQYLFTQIFYVDLPGS